MFPYLSFFSHTHLHTNTVMLVLSVILSLGVFTIFLKKVMSWWQSFLFLLIGAIVSFLSARLFHVLFEKPDYFLQNPGEIFTQFDGMTFYGSFIAGLLYLILSSKIFSWDRPMRARFWDAGVLCTCLTYFLMRVGCFANGCCWGSITAHPWGVQYFDPRSAMPYKGIPVHPVQLYDAFIGLVLLIVLFIWWKEKAGRGRLIWAFFLAYPVARFITEFFRGDSFRGEDILLGLSTSQLISVVFFSAGLYGLVFKKQARVDYLV